MRQYVIRLICVLYCCCGLGFVWAQPVVSAVIDNNKILIGEPVRLKVTATIPRQDFFVKWLTVPDTLQHFELVDQSKIDSVFHNQKLSSLTQTFTFTSFDSGRWTLPSFTIDLNPVNGDSAYHLFTDTFSVDVSYQADTTQALKDIKDIRAVKDDIPLWYWIAGVAGLLLLIGAGTWLYFYLRNKKPQQTRRDLLTPYQQALQSLRQLQQLNLQSNDALKQYYTGLTGVLKEYLSAVRRISYSSSTTGELLLALRQEGLNTDEISKVAAALRCGDAVKFAKYLPMTEENADSWNAVKNTIDNIERLQIKQQDSGS